MKPALVAIAALAVIALFILRARPAPDPIGLVDAERRVNALLADATPIAAGAGAAVPLPPPNRTWTESHRLDGEFHLSGTEEAPISCRMGYWATTESESRPGPTPGSVTIRHTLTDVVIRVSPEGLTEAQCTLARQVLEEAAPTIRQFVLTETRDVDGRRTSVGAESPDRAAFLTLPALPLFLAMLGEPPPITTSAGEPWRWESALPDLGTLPLVSTGSLVRHEMVSGKETDVVRIESAAQLTPGAAEIPLRAWPGTDRTAVNSVRQLDLQWTQEVHLLRDSGLPLLSMSNCTFAFLGHQTVRRADGQTAEYDTEFRMSYRAISMLEGQQ